MVYMYHSFLVHSSADGHLGCFHVLAMINSAAMVLWEDLEGAGGEGGGRGDRDGEDVWTQGLFISMYDKIHYK